MSESGAGDGLRAAGVSGRMVPTWDYDDEFVAATPKVSARKNECFLRQTKKMVNSTCNRAPSKRVAGSRTVRVPMTSARAALVRAMCEQRDWFRSVTEESFLDYFRTLMLLDGVPCIQDGKLRKYPNYLSALQAEGLSLGRALGIDLGDAERAALSVAERIAPNHTIIVAGVRTPFSQCGDAEKKRKKVSKITNDHLNAAKEFNKLSRKVASGELRMPSIGASPPLDAPAPAS